MRSCHQAGGTMPEWAQNQTYAVTVRQCFISRCLHRNALIHVNQPICYCSYTYAQQKMFDVCFFVKNEEEEMGCRVPTSRPFIFQGWSCGVGPAAVLRSSTPPHPSKLTHKLARPSPGPLNKTHWASNEPKPRQRGRALQIKDFQQALCWPFVVAAKMLSLPCFTT